MNALCPPEGHGIKRSTPESHLKRVGPKIWVLEHRSLLYEVLKFGRAVKHGFR